ncbi:MAG: hypothetical protein Ct9H300mP1_32920 [Planctomycetaceae bacterium]|nr:MAG: hypothetical protein Ct9H300mP1_32920 [Planctomycetaceae bacterium]
MGKPVVTEVMDPPGGGMVDRYPTCFRSAHEHAELQPAQEVGQTRVR